MKFICKKQMSTLRSQNAPLLNNVFDCLYTISQIPLWQSYFQNTFFIWSDRVSDVRGKICSLSSSKTHAEHWEHGLCSSCLWLHYKPTKLSSGHNTWFFFFIVSSNLGSQKFYQDIVMWLVFSTVCLQPPLWVIQMAGNWNSWSYRIYFQDS